MGFVGALCWRQLSLCALRGDVQGSAPPRRILLLPSLSVRSYLPEKPVLGATAFSAAAHKSLLPAGAGYLSFHGVDSQN